MKKLPEGGGFSPVPPTEMYTERTFFRKGPAKETNTLGLFELKSLFLRIPALCNAGIWRRKYIGLAGKSRSYQAGTRRPLTAGETEGGSGSFTCPLSETRFDAEARAGRSIGGNTTAGRLDHPYSMPEKLLPATSTAHGVLGHSEP